MLLEADLSWLTSDVFYTVFTILLGLMAYLGRKWYVLVKVRDALKLYVPIAYDVVNDIAQHTETKIDDKIAEGLRVLKELLQAEKIKATPDVLAVGEAMLRSQHQFRKITGQNEVLEKLAVR